MKQGSMGVKGYLLRGFLAKPVSVCMPVSSAAEWRVRHVWEASES